MRSFIRTARSSISARWAARRASPRASTTRARWSAWPRTRTAFRPRSSTPARCARSPDRESAGVDISDRGLVVASGEGYYGYLVAGSDVTRLDKLPAVVAKGWHHMEPTGISDHGWIVGTGFDAEGNPRAFLLVPGGGVRAKRLDTASKG